MITALYVGLMGLIAIIFLVVLIRLGVALRTYRYRVSSPANELPTVSVCIPARNEMHAMTECLERVLASDYPKLEIIVLDDSSVDDTSMLIKSFAHAGVRFVEGQELQTGWLGKNNALQGLLGEASGQFVLFLDVDTTLKPHSIRRLVDWQQAHTSQLVSVLPEREDGLRASVFLGTLRYFWLLIMDSVKAPAVSGAAWLVSREALVEAGGFQSVKLSTQPEITLASMLRVKHGSQLIVSNKELGISYEKKWSSQVETSIRLLRPLFKNTAIAGFTSLVLLTSVTAPAVGFVFFAFSWNMVGMLGAGFVILLITAASLCYFKATWRYGWWLGALHWPYVMTQEAVLIVLSIVKYGADKVTWKGRSISTSVER